MKTNQKMWTRLLSMALTVCMLLGIVAVPNAFAAEAAEAEASGALSTPIYTNPMDKIDPNDTNYLHPVDWTRGGKGQFGRGSKIIVAENEGDRQYYQYKRNGKESAAISWASSDPIDDYSAAVLKYDVMINNAEELAGWTVYLPTFEASVTGNNVGLDITDYALNNKNEKFNFVFEAGEWYTVEMLLAGKAYKIYIAGKLVLEGTLADNVNISCVNMGIAPAGGNPDTTLEKPETAGANVAFNIDNLEIYACAAATSFAFAAAEYAVDVDATVATAWNAAPANAYIPAVTYSSSDELVATVDANGVVTGVSAGTATITATPADASGAAAATATVVVTDPSGLSEVNKGILTAPAYTNNMDAKSGYYPTGWGKSSKAQDAKASSIVTADGRTYYRMKRNGTEGAGISWATINPIADYSAAVLKYDVMIDNGDMANWEVHLPAFTNDIRSRALSISIKNYEMGKTGFAMTAGQWYTFEIVLVGADWTLFVDGVKIVEATVPAANQNITCLNMGISNAGGSPAEGQSAGANVAFNIDNMEIYTCAPATSLAYENAEYTVSVGEKIAPALFLAPAGAYMPYITYTTSDPAIATVGVTGVVTAVAEGTATITATPAPGSGMAPVTTTVTVTAPAPTGPEKADDLVFLQAPSLSFQDYIGMQLLTNGALAKTYDEIYVEAVQVDPTAGAITTKLVGSPYYGVYLLFDQQILSWSMAENVTLTLYGVKDGKTFVGQSYSASVESLALSMLAKNASNEKICRVLVDMLNYGAAVQTTFKHNAAYLPNTQLGEFADKGTSGTPEMSATNSETGSGSVAILQTSISMQSKVEIQFLFAQNISAYEAKAAIGETALNAVVDTETMGAYGYTIVKVAIGAANMRDVVTFALYDTNGNPVTVVKSVSVEALVKNQVNGAQGAVIVAMMHYGDAVAAYANK